MRAYLAGLAVLFVLAAGAAVVYGRVQAGDDARDGGRRPMPASPRGWRRRRSAGGSRCCSQTVAGAAANPGIAKAFASPEDCGLSFGGTDAYTTGHLDLVRPDGSVACSSMQEPKPRGYEDAAWLARALREPAPARPGDRSADRQAGRARDGAGPEARARARVVQPRRRRAEPARQLRRPARAEFVLADQRAGPCSTRSAPARWTTPLTREPRPRPTRARLARLARRRRSRAGARRHAALNRRELTIIVAGLLLFLLAAAVVHRPRGAPAGPARQRGPRRDRRWRGAARSRSPGRTRSPRSPRRSTSSRAVRREQEAYRVVFEGSPLPMWVHDTRPAASWRPTTAAVDSYGYSHEELLTTTRRRLERAPGAHARKDGTTIEVSVASHAIDFRGREACVVIAEDVTEKERLRAQLQQSQRLESLGQLAGGIAHDFNNLLAVILGYASFIERRAEPGSARRSATSTQIREAGERARRLTRQLLAFARREVVRPRVLDLTGVVLEMEQLLRRTLGEHVVLRTSLAPDLWPIMADHGQLEQVLINLAVNARDAMPEGGTLTLDTENIAVDGAYAQHAARARARPLRAPAGQRHRRRHDAATSPRARSSRSSPPSPRARAPGSAWRRSTASSPRPAGTCRSTPSPASARRSRVLLPATDAPVPDRREPTDGRTPGRRRDDPRGRGRAGDARGDAPDPRRTTATTVLTAGGGREALRLADEHHGAIDLLLTDVVMPEMLGKEVAERVTALRPEHPRAVHVRLRAARDRPTGPMGDLAGRPRDHRQAVHRGRAARRACATLLASRASP